MASASGTGGCGKPYQRHEQILAGEVVGERWKDIAHDVLMQNAVDQARRRAATGADAADEPVVVKSAVTLYVNFPPGQEVESADAQVSCACTITVDETGEVCVCIGACDFDACCGVSIDPPELAGQSVLGG